MKLGGSVVGPWKTVEEWQNLLKQSRFAAITSPVDSRTDKAFAADILAATREAGVLVAEVGVWKNPLSKDRRQREEALQLAKAQLAFAEEHGIPCCVNIAGSRGDVWDGAHKDNYTRETYELLVFSVQDIIDSVSPKTASYTLESMPWMLPDGPEETLQLISDVNRPPFQAHLDFVNMINSPRRFLYAAEFVEECLIKLGPHIKSTHLKDSFMEPAYTCVIRETAPGKGQLDLARILKSIDAHLPKDAPVLLEHMHSFEDYAAAFDHVAGIAARHGIPVS